MAKTALYSIAFILSLLILLSVGYYTYAWTNPTQNPPNGNVSAPVNIGSTSQTKSGSFFSSSTISAASLNATSSLCIAGSCKASWSEVGGGSNWTVSGSDIYRLSNVAIGTSATSSQLHVFNSANDNILKLSRGNSTSTIFRVGTDGALVIQNQSTDVLAIKSGNVGIGTASPGQKLEVAGNVSSTALCLGGTCNSTWPSGGGTPGGSNGAVQFASSTTFGGDAANFFWDNGNKRLGIGTSTPSSFLDVRGSVYGGKFISVYSNTTYNGPYKLISWGNGAAEFGFISPQQIFNSDWNSGGGAGNSISVRGNSVTPAIYGYGYNGNVPGVLGYNSGSAGYGAGVVGVAIANPGIIAQSGGSTNDALVVYSLSITVGRLAFFNHLTSNFIGDALQMRMADGSGSFFGNFINLMNAGATKFKIAYDGKVSIGTATSTNILTVEQNSATDPVADAWTTYSSRRWKTNIVPIEGALAKILRLQGVTFDWKADGRRDIGFIAEDVGKVIPEVVAYEENGIDARSMDYARLTAVLVEAMKEQQAQIDRLKQLICKVKPEASEACNPLP